MIILADGFEEIEAVSCIDILRRSGAEVVVAGLRNKEVKASRGLVVVADTTLDKAGNLFDALILPGGSLGAKNLSSSERVKNLILEAAAKNKVIAAICASPAIVLAPLGILRNRSATCYPGMENYFEKSTSFKNEPVVIDGNIITSRGAGTAFLFALAIAEKMGSPEKRKQIEKDTAL